MLKCHFLYIKYALFLFLFSVFVYSANLSLRPPQSPRDAGLRFQQPITPPQIGSSSNPHTPASPHMIAQNHPHSR